MTGQTAVQPALQLDTSTRLRDVLDRLVSMSEKDYYNPYQLFQWPDRLPDERYWMSPELLSVHGTEVGRQLTEEQLHALSKWESINFYSLNVHGIRELLTEIIARIHIRGFEIPSEYFHHIIGEENEHMWFFATFCLKYGGKVYPDRTLQLTSPQNPLADNFLVFSRLLIFEEVVDFYNQRMGFDERLHPTIQQVNRIHHQDESRHIAFGRQIVSVLYAQLRAELDADQLAALERYLKRYIRSSLDSFCNPAAFADAGIDEPYQVRRAVLADPARRELERKAMKRTTSFMAGEGIFTDESLPAA